LPGECRYDGLGVFSFDPDQNRKSRLPLYQSGDMGIGAAGNQVAFPMARNSSILDFWGAVTD